MEKIETKWKGAWTVKGFKSTRDSIEAFEETVKLGEKSTVDDVMEYYNRKYPYNVKIEVLGVNKLKEVV